MCGICGILTPDLSLVPDRGLLERMRAPGHQRERRSGQDDDLHAAVGRQRFGVATEPEQGRAVEDAERRDSESDVEPVDRVGHQLLSSSGVLRGADRRRAARGVVGRIKVIDECGERASVGGWTGDASRRQFGRARVSVQQRQGDGGERVGSVVGRAAKAAGVRRVGGRNRSIAGGRVDGADLRVDRGRRVGSRCW